MIGTTVGSYRILRQLGAGGMGVIYEAEDTRLGRHVALKFLPAGAGLAPDAVERFEREARIASALNHPNICTIYDIGVHQGADGPRRFIVMELLDGDSLRQRIHGQPLPLDQVLDVGCQIADALDAAHAQGIIHRDIKPANIFITRRGQAKLLDFGIAKLGGDRHAAADAVAETRTGGDVLTAPGTAVGSVNYMSPEQARGEDTDQRTDLFSLGLVLYEMITGRQAFAGQTTAVVFDAILNREPAAPHLTNPQTPSELERMIARALEKDRRLRYQTAADMLAELRRLRPDVSRSTASTAPLPTPPPAKTRPRWLTVGAPAAAVVLAVAAYILFFRTARTPAFTEKDTLLVADFVNTTNDPVFDDALKQAVLVQLQQTPYLTLLSDQRVQRALQFMQRQPGEAVTGAVAREACQRSGAKATVEGSIAPIGSSYVIALGVHNCQTGDPLAQQQVQARSKEDVLTALGGAVKDLRQHLGESLATIQKYDVPLTEATTRSLEALRAYALANKTRATRGDEAAIPFYQQALQHDPAFALAYAKLGVVSANIGRAADSRQFALKAYELRDKVSEYERLYILWNHATRVLEDPKVAYDTLVLMTTSYPRDYAAHNNLGVYYMGRGQFEEALAQYRVASDIAPDEALPLSNASYALVFLGRLDEADQVAQRSLALRPSPGLAVTLWAAAVRTNHPRAKALEEAARRVAPPRAIASVEASLALWRGKLADYSKFQDALRAQARAAHDEAWLAQVDSDERMMRAAYLGGPHVDRVKASLGPGIPPALVGQGVVLLAVLGDLAPARAALPRLEAAGKTESDVRIAASIARSYVRAADGHPNEAVADLQATLNEFPRALDLHFPMGVIRERAGDLKGAAAEYRSVLAAMPVLGLNPLVSLTRMRLASLLVKDGDAAGAREQLDALLAQWKDADTDFDLLKQAKAARAAIK